MVPPYPASGAAARLCHSLPMEHEHPSREGSIDELWESVSGPVLVPGDPDFAPTVQPWNLAISQQPSAAVVAHDPRDVSEAVRAAAAIGLPVAVQATGHGVGAVADGALLIVTSQLRDVHMDPVARTARVGAGVLWSEVVLQAQDVGLVPLMGSSPNVGAVGYTLGGGVGWLARRYGLACDSVRSLDVVTADGERRTVSATEQPDLFWALRGAGPAGLAVVLGMEIDLFPVTAGYGGNLVYPPELAGEVLRRYRGWIADAPEELTSSVALMNLPPLDIIPEPLRGQSWVMVRGLHCGETANAEALLSYWRDWRQPAMDMFGEMPMSLIATVSNDPEGPLPGVSTGAVLGALTDDAVETLLSHAFPKAGRAPFVQVEVRHLGGATARPPQVPSAFDGRDVELLLQAVAMLPDPQMRPAVDAAVGALQTAIEPYATGRTYLNFLEGEEKVRSAQRSFTPETLARLAKVKRAYDPAGLFRFGLDVSGAG